VEDEATVLGIKTGNAKAAATSLFYSPLAINALVVAGELIFRSNEEMLAHHVPRKGDTYVLFCL
jgi:hypothetical protein